MGMNLSATRGRQIIPEKQRIRRTRKPLNLTQIRQADAEGVEEQHVGKLPYWHVMRLAHGCDRAVFIIWYQIGEQRRFSPLETTRRNHIDRELGSHLEDTLRAKRTIGTRGGY